MPTAPGWAPAIRPGGRGLVAGTLDLFAHLTLEELLRAPKKAIAEVTREQAAG